MASLGHLAVGLAAARLATPAEAPLADRARSMVVLSLVSFAPDADVVAFALGIPYAAPWGHRGAVHSLALSFALGALAGVVALPGRSRWRGGLVAGLTGASHPLLDTLTNGGLGMALLWPFSTHRFFAPWRPIPVAPIGAAFFSSRGLSVVLRELAMFSPLFLFALWPRRKRRVDAAAPSSADL